MQLSITYELFGTGWSKCIIKEGENSYCITASYLCDALGDLILAAINSISGFQTFSFGFDVEPGEFRWVFERTEPGQIRIQILEFPELWGNQPNEEGKILMSITCHPKVFAVAVQQAAIAVLAEHGEEGFLQKWVRHTFPSTHLSLLSELIAPREDI